MKRRTLTLVVALVAAVLGGAGEARAADECRGLQVCLPVPGPWVAIPGPGGRRRPDRQLGDALPPARLHRRAGSTRASRIAPSTSRSAARTAPPSRRASPPVERCCSRPCTRARHASRRPSGRSSAACPPRVAAAGARPPSGTRRRSRPGKPLDRRVVERRLLSGASVRATGRCPAGTRLLGAQHAFAFRIDDEPGSTLLNAVRVRRTSAGRTVTAVGTVAPSVPQGLRVLLQLHVLCSKAGR